jgi:hypothetical protein
VTQYHREYRSLLGRDALDQIHREIKDNIWHFVNIYRSAKSAGIEIPHIINLLNIANNNLPSVQTSYYAFWKTYGLSGGALNGQIL